MRRLLVGMMVAGMLLLGMGPAASAAEIPPTAECQATFRTLFREYVRTVSEKDLTNREERKLDRKLSRDLFAANCLSAVGPIYMKDPISPKSPECVAGAKTAAAMWKVAGQQIDQLYRKDWRKTRAIMRKAIRLENRMLRLKRRGGDERKIKRLDRRSDAVMDRLGPLGEATLRKASRIVGDQAAANVLTFLELASLGCLDLDYSSDDKPAGPADRVVKERFGLIITSYRRIAQSVDVGDKSLTAIAVSALLPVAGN